MFHEKRGDDGRLRRHAYAVWCRIETSEMKARQLSFTHSKLQSLARELYLENNWEMPRGLLQKGYCDPHNFTLAEWQQAKRRRKNSKHLKALFQDAWAVSDDQRSFSYALLERGFILARGDRRGYVAIDHTGEAYSVSRWVGTKAKEVSAKLGEDRQLPCVMEAHLTATILVINRLEQVLYREKEAARSRVAQAKADEQSLLKITQDLQSELSRKHRIELQDLKALQYGRLRKDLLGFLQFLSGRRKRIAEQNLLERRELRQQRKARATEIQRATSDEITRLKHASEKEEAASLSLENEIATELAQLREKLQTRDHSGDTEVSQSKHRRRQRDGPIR